MKSTVRPPVDRPVAWDLVVRFRKGPVRTVTRLGLLESTAAEAALRLPGAVSVVAATPIAADEFRARFLVKQDDSAVPARPRAWRQPRADRGAIRLKIDGRN